MKRFSAVNDLVLKTSKLHYVESLREFCETDEGPYRRPFSPNPSWESADVLVVGTNPATPMRAEFDSFGQYWNGLTQDPKTYFDRYSVLHGGGTSKSTKHSNLLLGLLEPLNVLVSNVVWFPAQKKKHIPRREWDIGMRAIQGLYEHINPRVVLCHGADAERFAKQLYPQSNRYLDPKDQMRNVCGDTLVLCYHHFSGQGLRAGARFRPAIDLPAFANGIHNYLQASSLILDQ